LAISEQYQSSPSSLPGVVVALSDRLDTLTGLFAAGLLPSATKDPFGLRRAALGVVMPLVDHEISIDLRSAIRTASQLQPISTSEDTCNQVFDFIKGRMRVMFLDSGFRHDIVDAVLAVQAHNPYMALQAIKQLTNWAAREDWSTILHGYARCVRITRDLENSLEMYADDFQDPPEKNLLKALQMAQKKTSASGNVDDFLSAFVPMLPAINKFFDDIMVMVDDRHIRENRLALLQKISSLAEGVADLSLLEGF